MIPLTDWLADTETTQAELATKMGVSQPAVSDWINGHTFPSIKNLRRLSKITGLTIDELLHVPRRTRSEQPTA
jgi:transcriptional regulator with XRE-family HTH domain